MSEAPELLAGYHPEAQAEIAGALHRYRRMDAEYPPGVSELAAGFRTALIGADWKVTSAPLRWAPHILGTRRVFLPKRFRHYLVYLPDEPGGPVVIAVAHEKRDEGYWRDRLPSEG